MRRGEIRQRTDVNYAATSSRISKLYVTSNFPLTPLENVVHRLQYGTSILATEERIGLPVLRMNNLQDDGWDLSNLKYIDLPEAEAATYLLNADDLLFNRTNSKELVGKCAVFREPGKWLFASYLIRVSVDQTKILPDFLSDFLSTPAGRLQIDGVSRQIVGMSNINAEEIKQLKLPLPPLSTQHELVAAMQSARARRAAQLAAADAELAGIDAFLLEQLGLTPPPSENRTLFAVRLSDLQKTDRLNADYFHPERIEAIRTAQNHHRQNLRSAPLHQIVNFVRDQVAADADTNYLGLANVQSNTGELVSTESEVGGICFAFHSNDVLFGRLRPYLNKVYKAEGSGICSTEFHVMRLRPAAEIGYTLLPEYLAAVLRSSLVLAQTRHMMTGNTHPRLANEDVVNLIVPVPLDLSVQTTIAQEVQRRRESARDLREQAGREWEAAKAEFERRLLGAETEK